MKTKITLTILGTYNTIVGIMMIAIPSSMAAMMVNSDNNEVLRMGELMHYGLSPAILIIGLMLLFTRNSSIGTAKNISKNKFLFSKFILNLKMQIRINNKRIIFS